MAKLAFVVTEDWYFYSHRRPMIAAAQECGFEVCVITHVQAHREKIEQLGVKVIPFSFERRSLNPLKALAQIQNLKKIYEEDRPDIVHHIAMKPILLGSLAAWMAKIPRVVNAFAGLGYVFNANSPLAILLRIGLWLPFFILLRRKNTWLLFQNRDDLGTLEKLGLIADDRARVIRGSGVDLAGYPFRPLPDASSGFICAYAGRMIGIKGLPTLKEAFALLEKKAPSVRLRLYGAPDAQNPGSWSEEDLRQWAAASGNVSYEGQAGDMAAVWADVHAAVQASYGGEGVPKSLLEAASCGRPIIATDVPGCREVVEQGRNGFLVPPYDAAALAGAIERLAADAELCRRMGQDSRRMVENDMAADKVQAQTAEFYRRCLSEGEK